MELKGKVRCEEKRESEAKKKKKLDSLFENASLRNTGKKMSFLFRLLHYCCCCCCCCRPAKVSPDETTTRGGVPPLPALPAPAVRQLIKATPEWEKEPPQPPQGGRDPLSLDSALPPGPGAASVLARAAALESAAPRATASMFKAAAESLERFYDQATAATAAAAASRSPSSSSASASSSASSSSSSSSAAALAAVAEVFAVVEEHEKRGRGRFSKLRKLRALSLTSSSPLASPPSLQKLEAKAAKKKPKRVRKAERRAVAALYS